MDNKKRITDYYHQLDRSYFMDYFQEKSHEDRPFPIGDGQTISQPSLVLKMTLLLDIKPDSKVLEIGTGSGYQTALLAEASQMVYTVETIRRLHLKAQERLKDIGHLNIKYKLDDGNLGWEDHAPYDRIMVTAAPSRLPQQLVDQLAPGGKMIIPVGTDIQDLMLITKDLKGNIDKESIAKVRFVKLIGKY